MKTPGDKKITLAFHSEMVERAEWRWKATLTFEPGSTDETMAVFDITDLRGNPVDEGILEFAGQSLPVRNGHSAIRCADFVKGKHETGVWLHRRWIEPVMGGLTFG